MISAISENISGKWYWNAVTCDGTEREKVLYS